MDSGKRDTISDMFVSRPKRAVIGSAIHNQEVTSHQLMSQITVYAFGNPSLPSKPTSGKRGKRKPSGG